MTFGRFLLAWGILLLGILPTLGEGEILEQFKRNAVDAPFFRFPGRTYQIRAGESVTMPCVVEKLGSSVIVWKQTNRIISAGMRLIRKDNRMKLIQQPNGISLRIDHIIPDDKGEYICELETFGDPLSQSNELHVLVPPVISILNTSRNLTVRKDSTVTLACNATGYPMPQITWQREYQMLPSGEKEKIGTSLVLGNVSRLDSGTYFCTANNGVEAPVSAEIQLQVIYEPEVHADKSWVHADVGVEVEISCIVHAQPAAEIKWYRDTMLLDPNERRLMEKFGKRHTLVIRKMAQEDFGNYSCQAENGLGKARAFIELSGHPNQVNITSQPLSYYRDRYNLTWTVNSFSEVTQYRILYRKVIPEEDPNYDMRSRWHNIVPTMKQVLGSGKSRPTSSASLQFGRYMFYALEPSTRYEVVMQCKNKWGWSQNSQPFIFSTRANDYIPKELASQPGGSHNGDNTLSDVVPAADEQQKLQLPIPGKSSAQRTEGVLLTLVLVLGKECWL